MGKSERYPIVNLQYVGYLCSLCILASSEIPRKASTITKFNMRTDKILICGQPYEAPTVTSLDILSEGLLCQSLGDNFDRNNHTEKLDEFDFEEI